MSIFEGRKWAVVSVLGMRGQGKTYLSSKMVEELQDLVDKVYFIDVVGAYDDYLTLFADDYVKIEIDTLVSEEDFLKLFKRLEKTKIVNVIYDISLLTRKEMVEFMDMFSKYLLRVKDKKQKVAVICDEVGEYAEQERAYYSQLFETLVRVGRNKNILYVVLITQRAQKVNKHLLALSDIYIIFRLMHNLDLEAVKNLLGYNKEDFEKISEWIKELDIGQYIMYDGRGLVYVDENGNVQSLTKDILYKKKKYAKELVEEALKLYVEEGYTAKQVANKLNVPYDTVRHWIKESKVRKKRNVKQKGED